MSHYRWLEERIPALAQCGQAAPFLHLTSRIEGGEGADADISLEDDGAVSIAITEVDSGGRRVAVCAALSRLGRESCPAGAPRSRWRPRLLIPCRIFRSWISTWSP